MQSRHTGAVRTGAWEGQCSIKLCKHDHRHKHSSNSLYVSAPSSTNPLVHCAAPFSALRMSAIPLALSPPTTICCQRDQHLHLQLVHFHDGSSIQSHPMLATPLSPYHPPSPFGDRQGGAGVICAILCLSCGRLALLSKLIAPPQHDRSPWRRGVMMQCTSMAAEGVNGAEVFGG